MHPIVLKNDCCPASQGLDNNNLSILQEVDRVSKQEANRSHIGLIYNT
jgi:hypothetical protein